MKKEILFLVLGMALVLIGVLIKINGNETISKYLLISGLALEAYILASLVIKSLKK